MSSFTIKTATLQSITNRVIKGAGNNKYNPITSLVGVSVEDNKMSMTTTDGETYFTLSSPVTCDESLSFTVDAATFCRIVSKTTVDTFKITVNDDVIVLHGNGTYKIDIQLDVDGAPLKFQNYTINSPAYEGTIKTRDIRDVIVYNKASLSEDGNLPCVKNYYCYEDAVVSADSRNITKNDIKLFGAPALIAPNVFELLSLCEDDEIAFGMSDRNIMFSTDTMKLFTVIKDGVSEYPMHIVDAAISVEYPSQCTLPKTVTLNVIDRLSLFIKSNDTSAVMLTFCKDSVKVETLNHKGIESIAYQGSSNFADFSCVVDIDIFRKEVASRAGESFNLFYGGDNATTIAIKDGGVTQVMSLYPNQ